MIITGAGGTLGREFVRQLDNSIAVDNNEWSLAEMRDWNCQRILDDFMEIDPDGKEIIHCAAYKHVDLCEKNAESCWYNNVVKTKELLFRASKEAKDFVFISTDKAVDPASVYGRSKKEIEDYIKEIGFGKIVRMGNIYGSSGSVIPLWEKQIADNQPLTITDPTMTRYFISVQDAVRSILGLYKLAKPGQIIIPLLDEPITLNELKNRILKLHHLSEDYPCIITGPRPGEKHDEILLNECEKLIFKNNLGGIYEDSNFGK